MLFQIFARVILALTDLFTIVGIPSTRLIDKFMRHPQLNNFTLARYSDPIENIEFCLLKWRSHLVLDYLDPGLAANHLVALLDGTGATYIKTYRRVKFKRIATGSSLRITKHDPDLHPYLINENHHRVAALDIGREFT